MNTLHFDNVDAYVQRLQDADVNVVWDGWSLVFLAPDAAAVRSPYGTRQNDQWGFTSRIEPDSNGRWAISPRWTESLNAR